MIGRGIRKEFSVTRSVSGFSQIRCLVFDAVGTLIHANPPVDAAYQSVGAQFGSKLTRQQISARFRAAFQNAEATDLDGRRQLTTSEDAERRRWRKIVAEVLDDVADADGVLEKLWAHFGSPDSWSCFNDVGPTLERLRDVGVEVAIASNFDARLNAVCDGHPALAGVDQRVISSEVGYRKPSGRFFDAVLQKTGRAANEVLFVGDDAINDVVGPRTAGMQELHLQRHLRTPDSIQQLTDVLKHLASPSSTDS